MHPIALSALKKLLTLTERANARNSIRKPTLMMTQHSFAPYTQLETREQTDTVHAIWREAERLGAISIDWDAHAGENGQVKRLSLENKEQLVEFLQIKPLWELIEEAREHLNPWRDSLRVQQILSIWAVGKSIRGFSVHKYRDLVDALHVIRYCREHPGEDLAIRVVSAVLFHASKRLEKLVSWLDVLSSESINDRPRVAEEVFAKLGLVRYPFPALLAGPVSIVVSEDRVIDVPAPYIGIAPSSVSAVRHSRTLEYVLTVENLTTFNEFAALKAGALTGLLLFCPGMPSPSFLRLYEKILAGIPQGTSIFHYGDIDTGGFRIAGQLAALAQRSGFHLKLWGMNPVSYVTSEFNKELNDLDIAEIAYICNKYGWSKELLGVQQARKAFEQEALPLQLPVNHCGDVF